MDAGDFSRYATTVALPFALLMAFKARKSKVLLLIALPVLVSGCCCWRRFDPVRGEGRFVAVTLLRDGV